MARAHTITQQVARLARLARDLEQKRVTCMELLELLEPLRTAKLMVIEGEASMLEMLQDRLDQARGLLSALAEISDTHEAAKRLDALEGLLTDPEWEAIKDVRVELERKRQRQDEVLRGQEESLRGYSDRLADLRAQLGRLNVELESARIARAPVVREQSGWSRLDASIRQAERAVRERSFAELPGMLSRLELDPAPPELLIQQVAEKVKTSRPLAQQVQLLLLQARLDQGLRQYTVLLRTPSEPGTHGINIQGSTTIVEQDRQRVVEDLQIVTKAIEQGRSRSTPPLLTLNTAGFYETVALGGVGESKAAEAGVGGNGSKTSAVPASQAVGEPAGPSGGLRDFRVAGDASSVAPIKLNDLVQNVGDLMYSILIPEQMQAYLLETSCSLTITTNDLALPWELMYFPTKSTFLCLDRPVARMPMGNAFPRVARSQARPGKLRFLLVYSDPDRNLPSAEQEITAIKDELSSGEWHDQVAIELLEPTTASGRKLNAVLQAGDFDVIHFAGHAGFDLHDPDLSGLLLREKELFFAQKVRRLLRGRPLVFLNACQSGRTANEDEVQKGESLPKPAEGLASAFIYGGALGCIGSFWPVSDRPAADFAIAFYRRVLEGHMIGEAMRQARAEIKQRHPDQITWAAFVLYGDPTFTLVRGV